VIAYIGAVVLLVGVGFLYGTQYNKSRLGGRPGHAAAPVAAPRMIA
jgi:hypothetical protein